MSAGPPGVNGTTSLMGLVGYSAATAVVAINAAKTEASIARQMFILETAVGHGTTRKGTEK
jgi:hypothetical protein